MNAYLINRITAWIVFGYPVLLGVWELVLLVLRQRGVEVRTISMEARSIAARGLPSIAYAMTGMCAHWWITWRRPPWTGTTEVVCAVAWWAGLVAFLLGDAIWPGARVWIRHPAVAALIGGIGAWLLFPQKSVWSIP